MKKIDLSSLSKEIASKKMMRRLSGGAGNCGCACKYEGKPGGSTLQDNGQANYDLDIPNDFNGFVPTVIVKG
ncbi:MAG: TIGR04149 family rSAM-modified RiPP [Bacteroidales bacterium]|jgi:natural product precursor|nr:TIGR04149 family rSAM-modified RiPP [Bacteroidales bacterium]